MTEIINLFVQDANLKNFQQALTKYPLIIIIHYKCYELISIAFAI